MSTDDVPFPGMPEPPVEAPTAEPSDLHTDLAALLAEVGLELVEQTTMYVPGAGVRRWEALRDTTARVIVEHWTLRLDPRTEWFVRVQNEGTLVEMRRDVTLAKAAMACALAGLLPAEAAT